MAGSRKRRRARSGDRPAGRSKPAKKTKRAGEQSIEGRCWLCSKPLTSGVVAPFLGLGPFEVHQRCYEEALKS